MFQKLLHIRSIAIHAVAMAVVGMASLSRAADEAKYVSSENSCHQCHRSPQGNDEARGVTDWILKRETEIWETKDLHSRAYAALSRENPLSASMADLLRIEPEKDQRCLACHATNVNEKNSFELSAREIQEELTGGVTCQACHGPASLYNTAHQGDIWRNKSRVEKAALGLNDLHNPVSRAERCMSCHIGNSSEGKVLTHEMHAAGHPPLPAFEVETFMQRMPKHWHDPKPDSPILAQLDPQVRAEYIPAPGSRSHQVLASNVVALQSALRLLADEAEAAHTGAADLAGKPITWPRLANFDCYACHHELERPAWRQTRGYLITPGRPTPRYWPLPMVKVAIAHAKEIDISQAHGQMREQLAPIFSVLDARPFGDPAKLAPAAANVEASLADLLRALDGRAAAFDDTHAKLLLRNLCAVTDDDLVDFESARQVAFAFRVVYGDLKSPHRNDAEIQKELASLEELLKLSRYLKPSESNAEPIERRLADDLAPMASYDAPKFQAHMTRLSELLSEAKAN